jgi:hypothetical protein
MLNGECIALDHLRRVTTPIEDLWYVVPIPARNRGATADRPGLDVRGVQPSLPVYGPLT